MASKRKASPDKRRNGAVKNGVKSSTSKSAKKLAKNKNDNRAEAASQVASAGKGRKPRKKSSRTATSASQSTAESVSTPVPEQDPLSRSGVDFTSSAEPAASGRGEVREMVTGPADEPYPYDEALGKKYYQKTLRNLQIELLKVQRWVKHRGEKIVIVFEGRDAAGKGGTIKRFREHLNPRGARLVALNKPNETELGQWYFQRYISQLPTAGEIAFFDRSWYNRAGVEPIMGFCTPEQYLQFMRQVPTLERGLIDAGIRLFKLYFDVGRDEQRKRIEARRTDPLKHWKLSPMDDEAIARFDAYTRARDSMFFHTHTRESPWTVVRSDDKKRARLAALQAVLSRLPYPDKDERLVSKLDPLLVGPADVMFPMKGRFIFNLVHS